MTISRVVGPAESFPDSLPVPAFSVTAAASLPVSVSYNGGTIPRANVVRVADYLLLHGNGVSDPRRMVEMIGKLVENGKAYAADVNSPRHSSLLADLRAVAFVKRLIAEGRMPRGHMKDVLVQIGRAHV